MKDELIRLIVLKKEKDAAGYVRKEIQHKTEVFAEEKGVKRAEFYAAAREGIVISKLMIVDIDDFKSAVVEIAGKKVKPSMVEHDGCTYRIIRTYMPENKMQMELYLQEEE